MNEVITARAKSLLEHFSAIEDDRQPCKVMYPLSEVLLLVVCATMAACDDYDDIVLWGEKHLDFLRSLQEYHYGIACADWLRVVMNRIGPELFASCFLNFVAERLPAAVGQIAIDGKTSRRSHDRGRGQPALHLVSAYASTHSLVLGQREVADKSNEITAIPLLIKELGPRQAHSPAAWSQSMPWVANRILPKPSSISAATIFWRRKTTRKPPMPRSSSILTALLAMSLRF